MTAAVNIGDPDFVVPGPLETEHFTLRPITVDDVVDDYDAVMESRHFLRRWEQSSWPADDFTVEGNLTDLQGLQQRHEARRSYTYTVRAPDDSECWGCVYLFPTDATFLARSTVVPVGDAAWADVELVAYFWVRDSRMTDGTHGHLLATLRSWFADAWHVDDAVFVVSELFTEQVELVRDAGLTVRFELTEPDKPATFLVFG